MSQPNTALSSADRARPSQSLEGSPPSGVIPGDAERVGKGLHLGLIHLWWIPFPALWAAGDDSGGTVNSGSRG